MCWAGSRYRGGRYGWDGVSERQMETKEGSREVTRGLGWGHGRRVDCILSRHLLLSHWLKLCHVHL